MLTRFSLLGCKPLGPVFRLTESHPKYSFLGDQTCDYEYKEPIQTSQLQSVPTSSLVFKWEQSQISALSRATWLPSCPHARQPSPLLSKERPHATGRSEPTLREPPGVNKAPRNQTALLGLWVPSFLKVRIWCKGRKPGSPKNSHCHSWQALYTPVCFKEHIHFLEICDKHSFIPQ